MALHHVQLVGPLASPYATCTHHTQASVAHVVFKVTCTPLVAIALLLITNDHHTGAIVSKMIVSEITDVVFHTASLNCMYTVFVPSPVGKVKEIAEAHNVQFVGVAPVQKAT